MEHQMDGAGEANGTEVTPAPPVLRKSRPTADALIARTDATYNDVHAFALAQIDEVEHMLTNLRFGIEQRKQRAALQSRAYVECVNDSLEDLAVIRDRIIRIAEAVDPI